MDNVSMWAVVVGFLLPPVIALIQRCQWDDTVRASVAFIVCIIAGAGTVYFSGTFSLANWTGTALVIMVTSIATFKGFWNKTGITDRIERLTNGG